jgi:hypothetical protein
MLAPKETTIDGLKVRTTPLPAREARRLFVRLSGHVLPLVGHLVAGIAAKPTPGGDVPLLDREVDEAQLSGLGAALQLVFARLDEAETDAIFDKALQSTTVELGGMLQEITGTGFDLVFTGRPATGWKVLGFALVENYRDFFGGKLGDVFAGLKAAAMKKAAKLSGTPNG